MHEDDPRVHSRELLVREAPTRERPRPEVLDDGVGLAHELEEELPTLRLAEIEGDQPLAPRGHLPPERAAVFDRRPLAYRVADARLFHLDDVRAVVRGERRRKRPGHHRPRIKDPQTGKRSGLPALLICLYPQWDP